MIAPVQEQYGGYEAASVEGERLASMYDEVASLLNAKPTEIALVENATVGWCHAFYALDLREDPRETVAAMHKLRINIGASPPESTLIDSEARSLPVLMRAAPHYYNTEAELDRLVNVLDSLGTHQ